MSDSFWKSKTLGIVGGGNMAEALVRGTLAASLLRADQIHVFDILPERRAVFAAMGCHTPENVSGATSADAVLLATKPQHLSSAVEGLHIMPGQLFISILAGVPTASLEAKLPPNSRVVRVMPNTPLLVGKGMTALAGGAHASSDDVEVAKELFACSGDAVEVAENDLDAVTAVSGSGPAYVFYFIEAMLRGAEDLGLDPGLARRLVLGTIAGSTRMVEMGGDEADLRRRVTSPGGTTAAALSVLEDGGFIGTIVDALRAARERSAELGKG